MPPSAPFCTTSLWGWLGPAEEMLDAGDVGRAKQTLAAVGGLGIAATPCLLGVAILVAPRTKCKPFTAFSARR